VWSGRRQDNANVLRKLLIDECILFSKLISTDKSVKSVHSMYKYIKTKELECMFPNNIEIVMRMYLIVQQFQTAQAKGLFLSLKE